MFLWLICTLRDSWKTVNGFVKTDIEEDFRNFRILKR